MKRTTSPKPAKKPRKRSVDGFAQQRRWLERAHNVAQLSPLEGGSPHPTVKVGAVLVGPKGQEIATGANRLPNGIDRRRPERYRSGQKSLWFNCAEQMAFAEALRKRKDIRNATLYVTLEPCAVCAGLIVELGIRKVCVPVNSRRCYARLKDKWKSSIEIGLIKLAEAGVNLAAVDMGKRA
ncbi:MAG: hypothetical protein JO126_01150 [Alphaproteobacteria bacterium]|nr:hypothetical protein [Alphaproteobacteria bacterium]